MKRIFDWMREQMNENAFPTHENFSAIWHDDALEIINEAEAKWEAEVCEWHYAKGYYKKVIASPHKECLMIDTADVKKQPFCGVCGKPIKIAEVE